MVFGNYKKEKKMEEIISEIVEMKLSKVFIRGYGNIILEIFEVDMIGIKTRSQRDNKVLYIPWTSIIMIEDSE